MHTDIRYIASSIVILMTMRNNVPCCSEGTGEDVDLELLVDDFVTFYIAGKQTLYASFQMYLASTCVASS